MHRVGGWRVPDALEALSDVPLGVSLAAGSRCPAGPADAVPGSGEGRLAEQCVPAPQPTGFVVPSESLLGVGSDASPAVQHVLLDVSVPRPGSPLECTVALQVSAARSPLRVVFAVVLLKGPGARQSKVAPRDEGPLIRPDLRSVENFSHRLGGRRGWPSSASSPTSHSRPVGNLQDPSRTRGPD